MKNTIKIEFDLVNREFNLQQGSIEDKHLHLMFSFKGESQVIHFNNLQFGLLIQNENKDIIYVKNYPNPGSRYVSTDQTLLEWFSYTFESAKTYQLLLWVEESNIRRDQIIHLNIPLIDEMPDYEVE